MTASVPAVPQSAPPRALPVHPLPIRGWRLLAILPLFGWPLALVSHFIPFWIALKQYGLQTILEYDRQWLMLAAWNLGSSGALTLLSLWTLPQYLRKRRVAIPLMIAFFASTFVVGIVNYVINAVLAGPKDPPPEMFRVILSTVIVTAWIRYFHGSKVVRETFILP
jgi:hypothetical protein